MTNLRRQVFGKMFKLLDPSLLTLAYLVAAIRIWHLTGFTSFASFLSMHIKLSNILVFLGLLYSWQAIFAGLGLYESKRLGDQKKEAVVAVKASALGTLLLGFASVFFRMRMVTPAFIGVFWFVATSTIIVSRLAMREFLRQMRKRGRNLHHLLIIGTNARALEFAHAIDGKPELGYRLLGFADQEWSGNPDFGKNGELIVTDLEHFQDFLRERVVDEVAIALPMKSFYSQAAHIASKCQEQGVGIHVLASIFDFQKGAVNNSHFDGMAVTTLSLTPSQSWPIVCKRILDVFVSSVSLIILAPLMMLIAALIKLDSKGPVFFLQDRVGLNKRRFRMYKFRTMVSDAESRQCEIESLNELEGPVFKIKNDPRITRLGKYLRRTSIDELPQLVNVLKGDMSLVGPRPLNLRDYYGLDEDWLRRRFSVPPGMTCLWQVNGRSSVSFQKWMELDLQYIDHWSLWLDLKVMAKTIPAVLKGTGAA